MNFFRISTFCALLLNTPVFGQDRASASVNAETSPAKNASRILRSDPSDSVFVHVIVKDAQYDFSRNNFPFYILSESTDRGVSATPVILIKNVQVVAEPHASRIRKFFGTYLGSDFENRAVSSISKRTNLNQHYLYPFRLNSRNEVEELISYEVSWQQSPVSIEAAARGIPSYAAHSVLQTGTWYKIAVTQTGIHRITAGFLKYMGIDIGQLDPTKIRIYGNGGKMLPELNKAFRYDDLVENAIYVSGESDHVFNASDYVLFYATGADEWRKTKAKTGLKFTAVRNLYSDTSYYFLNTDLGAGKRVGVLPSSSQPANVSTNTYDYYNFHEAEIVNFGKTGRDFYGENFDVNTSYRFAFSDGDFVEGDSIVAQAVIAANYANTSQYSIVGNGLNFSIDVPGIVAGTYAPYANVVSKTGTALNQGGQEINLVVSKLTPKSVAWLDKLIINARRKLSVSTRQFTFRDTRVSSPGKVCQFSVNIPLNSNVTLWNISDPLHPLTQQFSSTASEVDFVAAADTVNEYCIAPASDYYTPVFIGKTANQDLHAILQADYVIVTHPLFVREAQQLANFHYQKEGLTYAIATIEQIYNEFSSGRPDISAIRDFVRMLYLRNLSADKEVKYLLLIGDGSYNNRNRSLVNNSNLIPTYQSYETLSSTNSVVSDDFYGMMDDNEGYFAEVVGKVDIGVGRFTCRSETEVKAVIHKIESYYKNDPELVAKTVNPQGNAVESNMGDWRNWMLFLGDDDDRAEHMDQANKLTEVVKSISPVYNFDKVLLDAYQRFSTPGGARYPDAAEDFIKRMKKGAFIFNYTGHGGEVGLTAERMIDIDIINELDNFNKLPLFITATCEFSRYDDPNRTSAGELCLLNPRGGAIAMLTTARLAYSLYNFDLNKAALDRTFRKLPGGKRPALGDIIQRTKSSPTVSQLFTSFFHLLGDPALTLAYPENEVVTTEINSAPVNGTRIDTLAALSKITIKGYVADTMGNKMTNFNGIVYPTVFDKQQTITGLLNVEGSAINYNDPSDPELIPFSFTQQKNILYRGKTLAVNGDFSFTFIVPKDISFALGPGKVTYYATDGITDANGYYDDVVVGGAAKNFVPDKEGPRMKLYMDDQSFVNGGLTNEKPIFFADLTDSSGINTSGTGIGHDL